MNITYKLIRELKPYKKNAKKHPPKQIEQIAESIKEFGFTQPVLIDKDGYVVAGHGRILGAKKLNIKEVPTVCLSDLTQEQIKAYRLADNKLNESEWDISLLDEELEELMNSDIDMELFGFEEEDELTEEATIEKVSFEVDKAKKITVKGLTEIEANKLYTELTERGYEVKLSGKGK